MSVELRPPATNFTMKVGVTRLLKVASFCDPASIENLMLLNKVDSRIVQIKKWGEVVNSEPSLTLIPLKEPWPLSVEYISSNLLVAAVTNQPSILVSKYDGFQWNSTMIENVRWLGIAQRCACIWSYEATCIRIELKSGVRFAPLKLTYDADIKLSKELAASIKSDFKLSTQCILQEDGCLYTFTQIGRVNLFEITKDRFQLKKTVQLSVANKDTALYGRNTSKGAFTVLFSSTIVHCHRSLGCTEVDLKMIQESNGWTKHSFSKWVKEGNRFYLEVYNLLERSISRYWKVEVETTEADLKKRGVNVAVGSCILQEDDHFVVMAFKRDNYPSCLKIYHKKQRKLLKEDFNFKGHDFKLEDGRLYIQYKDNTVECRDLFVNDTGTLLNRLDKSQLILGIKILKAYKLGIFSLIREKDKSVQLAVQSYAPDRTVQPISTAQSPSKKRKEPSDKKDPPSKRLKPNPVSPKDSRK